MDNNPSDDGLGVYHLSDNMRAYLLKNYPHLYFLRPP